LSGSSRDWSLIRLGIDSRDVFAPEPRGVGKALSELIRHLIPLISDWTLHLYTNRSANIEFPAPTRIKKIDIRGDRFNAWEQIRLPVAALTSRLDLLHCPSQTAPYSAPCPIVLTVHDLIPLRIDDGWDQRAIHCFRKALGKSAAKARRIIAISEFTRADLISEFQIDDKKIDVIKWGVHDAFYSRASDDDWQALSRRYRVASPYFVAFGGAAPRKNVARILQAFAEFLKLTGAEVQLLLCGVPSLARPKFMEIAKQLGMHDQVAQLGFLSDQEIALLLSRSEGLVYPSLYEGFGLPILEAMAAGAPVITSNKTSMPEIAGNAAMFVDPENVLAIADAMRECFVNTTLKTELRSRGYERAKTFRWEDTAEQTLGTYRKALGIAS